MFICQVTGRVSKPGEGLNKIVVGKRQRVYKNWDHEREETWESLGWEITREINATDEGILMWNEMTPEEQERFVKHLSN